MQLIKKRLIGLILIVTMVLNSTMVYAEDGVSDYSSEYYSMLYNYIVEAVLEDYLYADEISEEDLFHYAMEGIFDNLDDYSDFMEPIEEDNLESQLNASFVGIGVGIEERDGQVVVIRVYEDTPAERAGVLAGDVFYEVDGVNVVDYNIDELLDILLNEEGTAVSVSFTRGTEIVSFDMVREKFSISTASQTDLAQLLPDASQEVLDLAGYIKLSSFGDATAGEFEEAITSMKEEGKEYLILDLRNNTGGYVNTALEICNMIVPAGNITTFVDSKGNEFDYASELEEAPFELFVLVNEWSASASEITVAAIQDSGIGTVVGEQTYGKGVAQYITPIGDGYYIKLTYEEFLSRDKNTINNIGITPDYIVEVPNYIDSEYRFYLDDSHEDVYDVEVLLNFLGYKTGEIDYNYDEITFNSVKQFQEEKGLYPYGVCDYSTQNMLNIELLNAINADDTQLEKAVELVEIKINEGNE